MQLQKLTLVMLSIIALISFSISHSFTNAVQPSAGKTGCNVGTTEQTCGISGGCHNNTPNSGTGSVTLTFSDPGQKYIPGEVYDMTVTTSESGKVRFGFEITSVDPDGDSVGTFIIPAGITNLSTPVAGAINHRKYLGHKSASANNTWNFQWKAPAIDKGQLCFFVAGNAANGNNLASGDHIYTASLCIDPDNSAGIFAADNYNDFFSIQSLAYNELTLKYHKASNERIWIRLYDLTGKVVQTLLDEGKASGQEHSFKLAGSLTSGLYLVRCTSGAMDASKKIFIQK